MRRRVSNA
jgi:hypothetical protein